MKGQRMPLHTTRDPGARAAHIAEREAEEVYARTHDFGAFLDTFVATHGQAASELQPLEKSAERDFAR